MSPRPTTPAPARPTCGPACGCRDCGSKRAAMSRVLAEQAALRAARDTERTRILSMLERFAAMDEDAGESWDAEVVRGVIRAIEEGRHIGQDGDVFVAAELDS